MATVARDSVASPSSETRADVGPEAGRGSQAHHGEGGQAEQQGVNGSG